MGPLNKIFSREMMLDQMNAYHAQQDKVVFTNGCFDVLHVGHIRYLQEAKSCGDRLLVAVNSDASVRRLKGSSRPIVPEQERMEILAALESVDAVVLFDEDTPLNVITALKPDILVKGGDYTIESMVGADVVLANGGEVKSLTFIEGQSSTGIIERIIDASE